MSSSRLKQIGITVTPGEEARLAEIQRQIGARNPDSTISLTRAATIALRKGIESMSETKDAAD